MATLPQRPPDPALTGPWAVYETWAATARYHKDAIDYWNQWNLRLAIAGAILAALGQQIMPSAPKDGILAIVYRAPGVAGAAIIALAAYFASQVLAGNREKIWIECRAAAESLKSAIYLYRAKAAPFDGQDRGVQLRQRVDQVLQQLKDIVPRQSTPEADPSLNPLTVDDYITERVDDQIKWYEGRARDYQGEAGKFRNWVFALGAASVVLGVASTFGAVSVWVAVIATITGALTAHVKNQRYQDLTAIYSTTAMRLRLLKSEWAESRKTDTDQAERDAFLRRCEETMSLENGGWMALWSQRQPSQASTPPPAPPPSAGSEGGVAQPASPAESGN